MRARRRLRSAAPWLAVLAAVLAGAGCEPCPQVYLLEGDGHVGDRYNILLVGAGFESEEELDAFRALANQAASELLATPPYDEFAKVVNVYRADVTSPAVASNCSSPSCTGTKMPDFSSLALSAAADAVYAGRDDFKEFDDLQVTACWTQDGTPSGNCSALWLDGDGVNEVYDLAYCGPDIALVIVIANHTAIAGMGYHDTGLGSISISVVGTPLDEDPVTNEKRLTAEGMTQLVHEVGHGLGLHDEYPYVNGASSAELVTDANVWVPMEGWDPRAPEPPCPSVPWAHLMADCGGGLTLCCGDGSPGPADCPLVLGEKACGFEAACTVLRDGVPTLDCGCVEDPAVGHPGLWEGAIYEKTGAFRARNHCFMEIIDPEAGHCEGCVAALSRVLCEYTEPASGCPPAIPASSAACAALGGGS